MDSPPLLIEQQDKGKLRYSQFNQDVLKKIHLNPEQFKLFLSKFESEKQGIESSVGFRFGLLPIVLSQYTYHHIQAFNEKLSIVLGNALSAYNTLYLQSETKLTAPFEKFVGGNALNQLNVMFRTDFAFSGGELKLLEINSGGSIGGWESDFLYMLNKVALDHFISPQKGNLVYHSVINALLSYVSDSVARLPKVNKTGNVLLCTSKMDESYKQKIEQYMNQFYKDGSVYICTDKSKINFLDNGQPQYCGADVDAVILAEHNYPQSYRKRFEEAFEKQHIVYPDDHITQLLGDKLLMALLHEKSIKEALPQNDQMWIDNNVPFTISMTNVNVEWQAQTGLLVDVLLKNRKQFVLKKTDSLKGLDVKIGVNLPQLEWEALVVNTAGKADWIAQEFCAPDPMYIADADGQLQMSSPIWAAFKFGSHFGGTFARTIKCSFDNSLVNAEQGAIFHTAVEDIV